ncbi:MAG TPA: DUF1015 domain-containing protein [Tepidisphaeraceae bacterium]|nr:DUF1015 domain-containing protein [Tepidisphaeraceae bacterium]
MAHIRPFAGVHFARNKNIDVSKVIAPPYDVLDEKGKAELVARHPNNIVTVDLPHLPPKTVGPDEAYERANVTLQSWVKAGILQRDGRPALYPYSQTFEHNGRKAHRRGFVCLVRLSPFGQGQVVPHERTYANPIEDRLKLMRATGMQLSPIFGVYSDPRNEITRLLYQNLARPEISGTLGGVKHDLWSVIDAELENQIVDLMGTKPVYIADGHHRYTTAMQYQREAEQRENGGKPLPPAHPANWCMFVLVGMQDDGLIILPTHRLVGGLTSFHPDTFRQLVAPNFDVVETPLGPDHVDEFINNVLPASAAHTFGLYDGRTKKVYQLTLKNVDVLRDLEPERSDAWRRLDVAILQRYLLDEVIQPKFAGGKEVTKGYTADPFEVAPKVDGKQYQIALLLRSTPLGALEQLAQHDEVMPQKSTFFYPKLATGMVMNPLR